MNKNIWYTLLITITICTLCNIQAAADSEFPVVLNSMPNLSEVSKPFRFADYIVTELCDRWRKGDRTVSSRTPLLTALHSDTTAIQLLWARTNNISLINQPRLYWKTSQNLRFPSAQATRIIEHLLSTKKASANEEYEGLDKGNSPLHQAKHPEHVAVLIKYGADLTARNGEGDTPLEKAIQYDWIYDQENMYLTKAFLKGGAPVITDERLCCITLSSDKPFLNKMIPLLDQYRK